MEQRHLGRTGTRVSAFCLGTGNFGVSTEEQAAIEMLHAALDAGITFVDTANAYGGTPGRAEEIVGRGLAGRRDDVVLASKVVSAVGSGPNDHGAGSRHIIMQCEASLRRLRTDWIDLYQLHAWDPVTPLEETLRALDQLIAQGKIRYVGTSNFSAWHIVEALWTSDRRNLASGPVAEQAHYSMLHRTPEAELIPMARAHGVGVLVYSPLSGGILTGKYQNQIEPGTRFAEHSAWADAVDPARLRGVVGELSAVAGELGTQIQHLALAWVASRPGVSAVILGPRNVDQLRENLEALNCVVSDDVARQVDSIVAPQATVTP